ncbi:MAG: multicopper oxidase domain-containing protein [Nanoarchaeota archaeon]|nr:multicopper oxidase domain-containing protein [Nanoarchaeota archaeon]
MLLILVVGLFAGKAIGGQVSVPFFGQTQGPFSEGPNLPVFSAINFFLHLDEFEDVEDISYDPRDVPLPVGNRSAQHLTVDLVAKEVLSEITDGTTLNYWTFNGKVPGPLIRARVGDTITFSLTNDMSSLHHHSLDFHAVTGPGGGAKVLAVQPGETKNLTAKLLHPGLYIYHCASSPSVAAHMTHGQYGLLLVEPEGGLPPVDKEFYVVQGEFYTMGNIGDKGLVAFDSKSMLDENPNYIVFNGRVNALNEKMYADVGDSVRIFFGNGGVSKISSFHVIGEIFDSVYPEAAIGSETHKNIQTTLVPAGGATIVEFVLNYPGNYMLVDHSLTRMEKGAWGMLIVNGSENHSIYKGEVSSSAPPGH